MKERKIKTFSDFMGSSDLKKFLGHLIVEGQIKTWKWGRNKKFELHVLYTPVKQIIMDIKVYTDDLSIDDLKLTFKKGDSIDKVLQWTESNNYEVTSNISKTDFNI